MKFTYPSGSRPLDGYTIKRGVGQGGFGEVYYATSDGGKEVALKLIRRNLDVELRGVSQCLNLKHPNLVALFDTRVDGQGDSWVIMEYVPGESLEEEIARHPSGLPLAEALAWFHGIAAGVGYLHDRGIVHRDLKPGNIFNDEGVVKIGDYGLSKFISASRRSGQTESVGTVHYMAPEIANGRYGKEIDIYALGIILYELLTGQVPFEGESVGEVLMKHLTATPNVDLAPEAYRAVLLQLLEKDPQRRIHNVAELLAALPASNAAPVARPSLPVRARVETPLADTTLMAPRPPGPPPPPRPKPHGPGAEPSLPREAGSAVRKFRHFWNPMPTSTKVLCVVALAMLFGFLRVSRERGEPSTMGYLLVFGLVGAAMFQVFKHVRSVNAVGAPTGLPLRGVPVAAPARPGPSPTPTRPAAPNPATYYRRQRRVRRRSSSLGFAVTKSPRDQVTELIGSLLLAAAASIAATVILLIVQRSSL
ncbi:MAG TPA: serine/threonine-protein kinase, partial [Pirellulales bacterium]